MQTARRRLIRSSARTRNTAIMGRNHLFSTPYVPEELVNQAQVVLQGKSRNVIIRELQRTNLDVNQAVNNLLSRDDEDFDDADDGPEQMIQSDDLMSLLDSGFHNDHSVIIDSDFSEEVFPYPLRIRGTAIFSGSGSGPASGSAGNNATSGGGSSSGSRQRPRDEVYSFLERDLHFASSSSSTKNRLYSLASAIDSKGDSPTASAGSSSRQKRSEPVKLAPISFTDQYEYWPSPPDLKFVAIATTFSELVALTSTGQVCQWRWQECEPFRAQQADGQVYFHPKVPSLGLLAEKVTHLSASCIRASVVTESGKVATWIDESVCSVASKLEHPAVTSAISESLAASCLKISALYVSSYMSCVQMSNGGLFWWGVPPFYHRKKLNEKAKNERSKSKCKSAGGSGKDSGEISQGSLVCMRNSPIYQSGALAFSTAGGIPKVGQLVNSAWKMTDSCSFRVLPNAECRREARPKETAECGKSESSRTEMPPPPSPASSTSSDAGYNPPLPKRSKTRSSSQPERGEQSMNSVERVETWNLKDVVFMEDVKSMPVGRVIKVDGNFVAVKFSHPGEDKVGQCQASKPNPQADSNFENYMQDCRLMRKDELVAIRACSGLASQPPSAGSKAYDFVQRVPKRVHIPEHVQILAMTVTNMGLHAIAKIGGYRLSLVLINIVTGRIEQDCKLSIEYSTFFGSGANPHCSMIKLFSAGESDSTTVVICRDANGTLYPLAKDCTETIIREPISLNLGPVATVSLGVFSLPHNLLNSSTCGAKTHAAILGLAVEQQLLMSVILRSDIDQLRERLSLLDRFPHIYHSMIGELCDGNHNIIHMAVSVCFPTSNKSTSADGLVHSVDDDEVCALYSAHPANPSLPDHVHVPHRVRLIRFGPRPGRLQRSLIPAARPVRLVPLRATARPHRTEASGPLGALDSAGLPRAGPTPVRAALCTGLPGPHPLHAGSERAGLFCGQSALPGHSESGQVDRRQQRELSRGLSRPPGPLQPDLHADALPERVSARPLAPLHALLERHLQLHVDWRRPHQPGHLRVSHLRPYWLTVLLHGVCACVPQGPRLQAEANLAHRLLRLLGEVQV